MFWVLHLGQNFPHSWGRTGDKLCVQPAAMTTTGASVGSAPGMCLPVIALPETQKRTPFHSEGWKAAVSKEQTVRCPSSPPQPTFLVPITLHCDSLYLMLTLRSPGCPTTFQVAMLTPVIPAALGHTYLRFSGSIPTALAGTSLKGSFRPWNQPFCHATSRRMWITYWGVALFPGHS